MLVAWDARALYVGPSLQLAAHRNAVAVLAVALDGSLEVVHTAEQPEQGFRTCRTVLIEPNQLHLIRGTGRNCAFLYLDALSDDLPILRNGCRERSERASFGLDAEDLVIELLRDIAHGAEHWHAHRSALAAALQFSRARPDRRIRAAVDALMRAPHEVTHAVELARVAGLSTSRFQHLFKLETGVPFRRFRSWARLRAALVAAHGGVALTDAAHAAGFSSSAHLSSAFKEMFGMAPSQLLALKPVLVEAADAASRRITVSEQ